MRLGGLITAIKVVAVIKNIFVKYKIWLLQYTSILYVLYCLVELQKVLK